MRTLEGKACFYRRFFFLSSRPAEPIGRPSAPPLRVSCSPMISLRSASQAPQTARELTRGAENWV
jgi:hypothetical protein